MSQSYDKPESWPIIIVLLLLVGFAFGFVIGHNVEQKKCTNQMQKLGLGIYEVCLTEKLSGEKHCTEIVDSNRLSAIIDD